MSTRLQALAACCVVLAGPAATASAYWQGVGSGSGSARGAELPAGAAPTAVAEGAEVTVTWEQVSFAGGPLGGLQGGGYELRRHPAGGGAPVPAGGSCAGVVAGAAASLRCVDAVDPGVWTYTVIPVLHSWTGEPSAPSASVTTTLPAPTLAAAAPADPAPAATTGDVRLTWSAVPGAAGYHVYRRTPGGAYGTALNGATPVTDTAYLDSGAGLSASPEYAYVVRAVHGAAGGLSAPSNEQVAVPVSRPAAPAGAVTATAISAADVSVGWQPVTGATGYNLYRRTSTGAYDDAAPVNGTTPITATTYVDTGTVHGGVYRYVVRALKPGVSATLLSARSAESSEVTADGVAPIAPTSVTVGSGAGPLLSTASCGFLTGTRFVNAAGASNLLLTVGFAAPDATRTVTVTVTTPGSAAVTATVPAASTGVSVAVDAASLNDGTASVSARASDAAGNASASVVPSVPVVKDTVAMLADLVYTNSGKTATDRLAGTSECGARITAVQTAGGSVGSTYPSSGVFTVGTTGVFSNFALAATRGTGGGVAYGYDVTAADLAGNTSTLAIAGVEYS